MRALPLLVVLALLPHGPAAAQGWDPEVEGGEVVVVQPRPVELRHEFAFGAAILPLDAWYTAYGITGSYTYHPSRVVAWEVASGFLTDSYDTGLRGELLERFTVEPKRFEQVEAGLFSHLVLKPFYGKRSFMNEAVRTAETQVLLGAGVIKYSQSVRAAADAGMAFRLHFAEWFSSRLAIRWMLPISVTGGLENVLMIDVSGAFNFGSEESG